MALRLRWTQARVVLCVLNCNVLIYVRGYSADLILYAIQVLGLQSNPLC